MGGGRGAEREASGEEIEDVQDGRENLDCPNYAVCSSDDCSLSEKDSWKVYTENNIIRVK